ncbi:MAG: tetratricopeptide repeat protein [Myxococcales bacterium]|nr:tetratricopeptide repeat protein [Myxococcales bacterium]
MPEVPPHEPELAPEPPPAPAEDEFLYHLHRGSELLMKDRVHEAKEELEHALHQQPQDARSQDLLAGVYFRLGIYPRAIDIWTRLVDAFPEDPTLRVNLGLALLKTGQTAEALTHFEAALQIQPDHERAWGYMGLIRWRQGRAAEAREAFLKGGQVAMAERMDEAFASAQAEREPTPAASEAPAVDAKAAAALVTAATARLDQEHRAELRSAAAEAIEQLDADEVQVELAPSRSPSAGASTGTSSGASGSGAWRSVEPAKEPMPQDRRPQQIGSASLLPPLSRLLERWALDLPEDAHLAIGTGGELFVRTDADLHCRLDGLMAVQGELRTAAVRRMARGKELGELFGGSSPIFRWHGPVSAILSPPSGERFVGMRLDEDVLYLREHHLYAFDGSLSFESARLPLANESVEMTQVYGKGAVVISLEREPKAVLVQEKSEVRVDPARLLGWIGRLFPSAPKGTAPYSAAAPKLAFRGSGVVLIT